MNVNANVVPNDESPWTSKECAVGIKHDIGNESESVGITPASSLFHICNNTSLSTANTTDFVPNLRQMIHVKISSKGAHTLPPEKKRQHWHRVLRHTIFSVYRRLFSIVWLANIATFVYVLSKSDNINDRIFNITTAVSSNLFIAIAIRQDYIINWLYGACVLMPWTTPLRVRCILAKIYENGGLHSGASTCCLFWLIYLASYLTACTADNQYDNSSVLVITYTIVMLFCSIVIFAIPYTRSRAHNAFERTHRFAGWITTIFFWALILVLSRDLVKQTKQSMGHVLSKLPSFYLILANTIHIILPWTPKYRLRKITITVEHLSSRAIRVHFQANIGRFYTIRLSDSPLSEWHSFACFQDRTPIQESTNSVIIAKAGDWTSKTILKPRGYYWTKGLPTLGVTYMSLLFKSIVVVTTGSGIGPCLDILTLDSKKRPQCRVLWCTPSPEETYGSDILASVKECDNDALIWDTKKQGRPDILALTWQLYKESGAEAIFVISNPVVTKLVVYGVESRGVAAFGPVFDS